jgi:hypothetical protein
MEKEDWKPFRKALVKRIEISLMKYLTFLNSIFQPALILYSISDSTPILMSILLYHYKELTLCISEVE